MKNANCACRSCGRAFAGVDAFSAHWRGEFSAPKNSLYGRHCIDPADSDKFESTPGIDRISDPDEPTEKSIWGLARNRARAKAAFGTGRPRDSLGQALRGGCGRVITRRQLAEIEQAKFADISDAPGSERRRAMLDADLALYAPKPPRESNRVGD